MRRGRAVAMALGFLVAACSGGGGDRAESPTTSIGTAVTRTTPPADCPVPEASPRPGLDRVVTIYLFCNGALPPEPTVAVPRVVPDDGAPLKAAITQLLIGATPEEAEAGFQSGFSSFTAGGLRSVTVVDRIATLDFTKGWERTNNFGTATSSAVIGAQITDTVFGFPEVEGIELQIEGERFCGWESTCEGQPVPLWTNPASCSSTSTVTERDARRRIEVGGETSRFSICLDPSLHPLSELETEGCPFGYVSNLSLNGPDNYPIGFQVTGDGSCTVRNGDFEVEIVSTANPSGG